MENVLQWMQQQNMVTKGQAIVVGFSGGADSTCLVHFLATNRETLGIELLALHVHHGIRGEEADRDEAFCRAFCEERNIAYRSLYVDAPALSSAQGLSLEEAARILRYEALQEAGRTFCEEKGLAQYVIAVAHHQDDQAETILFHLCRGTGLKGLCGMAPKQQNVIRPLLQTTKAEILEYCKKNALSYCEDSTNEDASYTRNAIRQHALPLLESEVNTKATEHIAKLGAHVALAQDYLAGQTMVAFSQSVKRVQSNGCSGEELVLTGLEALHPYLVGRVIYEAVVQMLGRAKDVTAEQVERVEGLLQKNCQSGAQVEIRQGLVARKESDGIYLCFPERRKDTAPSTQGELKFTVFPRNKDFVITNDDYTKYFDYDKLNNDLRLRHREEGDYLVVDGAGHQKTLNRYMIDEKIPQRLRDSIWVLADGSRIVWIIGKRISEDVKVTEKTTKILKVEYIQ